MAAKDVVEVVVEVVLEVVVDAETILKIKFLLKIMNVY